MNEKAIGLTTTRFLQSLAIADGDCVQAAGYAQAKSSWTDRAAVVAALRAGVDALDVEGAQALMQPIAVDLWQLIEPSLLVTRLGLREVPLGTRLIIDDDSAIGYWGRPKPITAAAFSGETIEPLAVHATSIVTQEVLRTNASLGERALRESVRRAVVRAMNAALVDADSGAAGVRPASIAAGATAIPSSGPVPPAVEADLSAAVAALLSAGGDLENVAVVLHPRTAVALSMMKDVTGATAFAFVHGRGGALAGLPVVVSSALPIAGDGTASILLVDTSRVAFARGPVEFSIARHASIEMDSAPATGATTLVGLWERNLIGLRCELQTNWRALSGAVVSIVNVAF